MYDVAIIGAGVIGTAIARELSRYDLKTAILDREYDVCVGTSKANSGIIHAGYDPEKNTLMAKLNAEGNKLFDAISEELSVPFRRNGSLVVAFNDEQMDQIDILKQRGISNGITGLSILSKDELLKREKAVSTEAKGALFAQTAGIIDPMLLTISFAENAAMNGAEFFLNFEVESIKKENDSYRIISGEKSVSAKYVINAAGVFSDRIHNMASKPAFKINPMCGQYFPTCLKGASIACSPLR